MDFQIPHNFLIRNPPKVVQIGSLGARIRPFYQINQKPLMNPTPSIFKVSKHCVRAEEKKLTHRATVLASQKWRVSGSF